MYRWKSNKGYPIYWFSMSNYSYNTMKRVNDSFTYVCFSEYCTDCHETEGRTGFVVGENFDVLDYASNFIDKLPENPVLYFDESSNFPKTKLKLTNYKRTLSVNKADVIVLGQSAEVKCINTVYHIFTDTTEVFSIRDDWFQKYFLGDWEILKKDKKIGLTFQGPLRPIYSGPIKLVFDKTETIKMFKEKVYTKPFILDTCLDSIVNQVLPDPDLRSLMSIRELLNSSDKTTIKLGASLASGFNISKWPLTFRTLLELNLSWARAENGGSTVTIRQMKDTLKINSYAPGGWDTLTNHIEGLKEDYSEEDIHLTQDFVRTIPDIKDFCKLHQSFYLEYLPFIPDEYKH